MLQKSKKIQYSTNSPLFPGDEYCQLNSRCSSKKIASSKERLQNTVAITMFLFDRRGKLL